VGQTKWLNEDELRAWHAVVAAVTLLNRRLDQQLKEDAGISHLQYEILARLTGAPGGEMRMTELADALVTSKSGLTYQVIQLERAGLVRRRGGPDDPRAVYACLADAGRATVERAAPGHVALVRELLIDVLTPRQLAAVADGLGEVARRMLGRG
jgi:DNA-binding MarR family transcriptional regulator